MSALTKIYEVFADSLLGTYHFILEYPLLFTASFLAAALPVIIWLYLFFKKQEKSKKTVVFIFFFGALTAPALLLLQTFWRKFPEFNLDALIEKSITTLGIQFLFTFLLFAAMEEIIKFFVIRAVDKRTILISSINDALRYATVSALGFSFAENIYYLVNYAPQISQGELIGLYIFRSIFTMCAHMIFSGVMGYFYGIGKFSMVITEQQKITGTSGAFAKIIARIFNLSLSEGFRQKLIIRGLMTAIGMHIVFNYLLQLTATPEIIIPAAASNQQVTIFVTATRLSVIIFVIAGYFYLQYLLKRRSGHLILLSDPSTRQISTMAKRDEDVVIELIGMWFNEKRYVDVIHICERLLERDPDNQVVKLFKAKALDKMSDKDTYKKVLNSVIKTGEELSSEDKNIISRHIEEKEMFQKVKLQIRQQLDKEGKTYKKSEPKKQILHKKTDDDPLNRYTGEGTFKI